MLLFGHLGITAGIVRVCDALGARSKASGTVASKASIQSSPARDIGPDCRHHRLNKTGCQSGSVDYLGVLLGSLLPDILDKPSWLLNFTPLFASGRGYAHTFLFNLIVFIGGLVMLKYRKSWLLVVSFSSFVHLMLDQMWKNPVVLWWPLLGPIHRVETGGWWFDIIRGLFSDPSVYIPEIIGFLIILLLGYRLVVNRNVMNFIRTGVIT